MSITILAMINPFVQSHLILPLQAHSWLEIQASFRLIPHWTRLFGGSFLCLCYNDATMQGAEP